MLGEWNHLALLHGEPKYLTAEELEVLQCRPTFPHARLGILREPTQRAARNFRVKDPNRLPNIADFHLERKSSVRYSELLTCLESA